MQYLGGKSSLTKKISIFLESVRPEEAAFFDVFTGGVNIVSAMTGERHANDACDPLVCLYWSWLDGWRPPTDLSEEQYLKLKSVQDPWDPMTAFAGFGCAFGGKYFGGYARGWKSLETRANCSASFPGEKEPANFAAVAARSLERKLSKCADVEFTCLDFEELEIPDGSLAYLDPPYKGTTKYGFFGGFDHDRFQTWALDLSSRCTVVLSEYLAPKPWEKVAEFRVRKPGLGKQVESLFMVPGRP